MLAQDPNTGLIHYNGNITLADAMQILPKVMYARCQDATKRPAGHKGDWPVEGQVYPVRMLTHPDELQNARLAVLGFEGEWPFFNVFAAHRFEPVCVIFTN